MEEKNKSQKRMDTPIERHDTAAWSNAKKAKPAANVFIPEQFSVEFAKEHVDSNQK